MPKNPRTFWESPWITLCLSAIIRYQNPQFKRNQRNVSLWGPKIQKTPFNAPAEALSFLLQLLDGSFFRRTASGLPRHCGVTLVAPPGDWVFFRKVATFLMLLDTNTEKYASCQPLSVLHWPFDRIKNNQGCFPQGHCSRDAAACSSTEQGYKHLTCKHSQYMQTESKSWMRARSYRIFCRWGVTE